MDIIDRNRIRQHPVAVLARRAAERKAVKPAPKAITTRADLEAAITAAWSQKFPAYRLGEWLAANYGVVLINSRWLKDAQLREIHNRIINA